MAGLSDVADGIIMSIMTEITLTNGAGGDDVLAAEAGNTVKLFMTRLADAKLPEISRVLLYGSRARGDHRIDSDVDIAVVLAKGNPEASARHNLGMRLAEVSSRTMLDASHPVDVSAIIIWEAELREPDRQSNPSLYHNVLAEGIEISAAQ